MYTQPMMENLRKDLGQALREIASSRDLRAGSLALYDLTKALSNAGRGQEAAAVAAESKKLIGNIGREGSEETRLGSYLNVCKALTITETADEVTRLVLEFSRVTRVRMAEGDKDGALLALSESLLDDTNDVEKALAIILGIADGEQKDCANGHVCKAYARLGQANNALILASRIGDEAPFHWRSFYLAECVEVLSGAGAAEDALEFARQIQTDHSRTTALFAVAQSFADSGRGDEARTVLEQAQAIPGDRRSERESGLARGSMVLATLGSIDEALATADGIERERPRHSFAVAGICRAVASWGDLREASSLASKADNRDVAALGMVKGLVDAGRFEEAEDVLKGMKDEEQLSDGWETLGQRMASEGRSAEVATIVRHLSGDKADDVIRSLVQSLAREGKFQDAKAIVAQRWPTGPISRVEAMAPVYREMLAAASQLAPGDHHVGKVVEELREHADAPSAGIAARGMPGSAPESPKKGFFKRLFG